MRWVDIDPIIAIPPESQQTPATNVSSLSDYGANPDPKYPPLCACTFVASRTRLDSAGHNLNISKPPRLLP